jgi:beta-glucosidase
VVIYVGGIDSSQEGEKVDRKSGDAQLPGKQQELINQLAAVNGNLVVVLTSGGICSVNDCVASIKGLLYAFYPGQEGGYAIADVLFGEVNPGGKLPVTMPKTVGQLPPFDDDHRKQAEKGIGYRWFDTQDKTPLFPFGYGLSYTSFEMSNLTLSSSSIEGDQWVSVSVDVENTGSRAGDEVVQLYVSDKQASATMVPKQLKGFDRVSLQPGESKTVTMRLGPDELCFYDVDTRKNTVEAGDFVLRVGPRSDSLPLRAELTVTGSYVLPDEGVTDEGATVRMASPHREVPRRSSSGALPRGRLRVHDLRGHVFDMSNPAADPRAFMSTLPPGVYIVGNGADQSGTVLGVGGNRQQQVE